MRKQTLSYLKDYEMSRSSFYGRVAPQKNENFIFGSPRKNRLRTSVREHHFIAKNLSLNLEEMHKSRKLSHSLECGEAVKSPGYPKASNRSKFSSPKLDSPGTRPQEMSHSHRPRNVFKGLQPKMSSGHTLQQKQKQLLYENALLIRPQINQNLAKIRITKRKFKSPPSNQNAGYCPWPVQLGDLDKQDIQLEIYT